MISFYSSMHRLEICNDYRLKWVPLAKMQIPHAQRTNALYSTRVRSICLLHWRLEKVYYSNLNLRNVWYKINGKLYFWFYYISISC